MSPSYRRSRCRW